ncbi:MAG: Cysteine desulfurase [Candidatus Nomurabacteria bacterium GW2011_GWC2_39_41]|uniref:Cysteine desulfurase n=2 Tax=Candidatus Nomuraibacteriota TaxID=1752729 RepID=A0A837HT11_9BACT|nr:MAG: Cysteine desulfurase [Candidatus Nomurabacteria bacterium GW2011_GWD2_39_12]KKR19870.1 MAG: Cysteine desulfurase [Candidatus Nomurabacteria bacterium GW2011_GWC2_39_41]KKR36316.1 MAG: Cysteine desulfurase [Candidatus Nomurabacteria bacterium GW2011_GWE2_40_10]KKR37948.1 MAG: Cysteine desulfurase [Candidatus Nomurabacteria bacterium GW2011_GWB1_40_11]KKR66077.1 MAG: Cysteine desulfurase [Parcubacteria group bacterium GW2011_GWF1_40_5]KKR82596.1 MAG: Cysteine desulfurase [Candidatus Nomu
MKKRRKIYLDYASSALPASANPGAVHELGVKEKVKLEGARATIAKILNARNDEIIFTSGATESNNLAILGLVQNFKNPHIVTTNIEHASVLEVCRHLENTGLARVTYVPVEVNGIVDPKKIKSALRSDTVLVSVMYANNEIGVVEPLKEIAKEIRHYNKKNTKKQSFFRVFFHTDATQAISYLPINVAELGVDLMSFNNAKIYGEKGVGVLYVKKYTPVTKIMFGGEQEYGLRPGTENVALAEGLGRALMISEKVKKREIKRVTKLRDYFFAKLSKAAFDIEINGDLKNRLPNNINITIPNIPSDLLVVELSERGIMACAKSACKSASGEGSYVVNAIRMKENKEVDSEIGGVRFSLGRWTKKSDIDYTVKALSEIFTKLKKWYH